AEVDGLLDMAVLEQQEAGECAGLQVEWPGDAGAAQLDRSRLAVLSGQVPGRQPGQQIRPDGPVLTPARPAGRIVQLSVSGPKVEEDAGSYGVQQLAFGRAQVIAGCRCG